MEHGTSMRIENLVIKTHPNQSPSEPHLAELHGLCVVVCVFARARESLWYVCDEIVGTSKPTFRHAGTGLSLRPVLCGTSLPSEVLAEPGSAGGVEPATSTCMLCVVFMVHTREAPTRRRRHPPRPT